MKKNSTELVFILDRSGSMSGLEGDTIGGFNSMLVKQKQLEGKCYITTVLFDNNYELLHDRIEIQAVSTISDKEYYVGGSTALLDAIGRTINKIGNVQKNTAAEYRAENVLFVIITDGQENSSREYSMRRIKEMIEHQKSKYDWEFIFLGANIDAVETAGKFGISADRAQDFHADSEGVELNFRVMSETVASYRESAEMPDDWNKKIKRDYQGRGKKA
ncbi:MAG: VWA domain-containing protein [Clostridiaceae bacterium]|nr:VWA domain-containing protein [Clostridiaceae bacterium]